LAAAKTASAGQLLDFRREELKGVEKKLKALGTPTDLSQLSVADLTEDQQILLAEKTVLDTSIDFLEENGRYLQQEVNRIKNGGKFMQHMVLKVPDLDKEIKFWTKGYGFKVVRERMAGDKRTAFVANSPESLELEDGGAFALELVETKQPVNVGDGLAYMQLRVGDTPRLSDLVQVGKIDFAYGFLQTTSPAGYKVNLYVGEARRDPFELIALRVSDIDSASDFYQNALGMREVELPVAEKYTDAYGPLYGFGGLLRKEFERVDVFKPQPPKGSRYFCYGKNENMTMGVLLIPQSAACNVGAIDIPSGAPIEKGDGFGKFAILTNDVQKDRTKIESFTPLKPGGARPTLGFSGEVKGVSLKTPGGGGTKVSVFGDLDGYQGVWVDYQDFENEQPVPPKPTSLVAEFEEAMLAANKEASIQKKAAQMEEYEALGDAVRSGSGSGYVGM